MTPPTSASQRRETPACCAPAKTSGTTLRNATEADRRAVTALLEAEELEAEFVPDEFHVAENASLVVATARLKPLPGGAFELASVAVAPGLRGTGVGRRLVDRVLAGATGPVYALAVAPGFFAKLGFEPLPQAPEVLREKAEGICASTGFIPMQLAPRAAVHAEVRDAYGAIAREREDMTGAACSIDGCGGGYEADDLQAIPQGAYLSLGTGNPVRAAAPQPGETVVDLGSGAGVDVFLAARAVGPTGRAIGIDLTPDMVARAEAIAAENRIGNVAFHLAPIEHLPLPDATTDVIVSNCVVNLSPDKPAVLREAHRVLKPGGRFVVSDTMRLTDTPGRITCDCEGGALSDTEWREHLAAAGFTDIEVTRTGMSASGNGRALVRARKP